MAEPICEDEGLLQEWTPLTQLLQHIPLKTQRGLFFQNLNLTCLDVVPEFIALGTNSGFIYWYCRATGDLQRLSFENCHCSVTCIKIMSFSDYMVAVGTNQGTVIVFQIPKIEVGSSSDQIKLKQKQIERFTINGLHKAPVTSVEWDSCEMKVFSGDKIGCVVLTEVNLNLHISKSMELLNEQFEIVQLSYSQQILLISTVYRSIICDCAKNWKVHQVGRKERKILGKFGATLCKFSQGLVLYASRPGHRLWLSDKNGVVQQTLIFRSAVQSNCPKIQLINPIDKKEQYDTSFGKVLQFGDNKLITYNSEILYILHPGAVSVVSVLNSARKIMDLAVNENEIFILEGERSLLRISPLPDKYSLDLLYQPVSRRTSFNFDELAARIKDTAVESIKKITKDLIATNEQTSKNSPPALADEALELPAIVNLPSGFMPTICTAKDIEILSSIPNERFSTSANNLNNSCLNKSEKHSTNNLFCNDDWREEVITRPLRKHHKKLNLQSNNVASESESDATSNISDDRLVCGVANDLSLSDESAFSQSQSGFSVLRDISSLLDRQKIISKNCEKRSEEVSKASDTKSQTSLDTCESVSEHLLLTSEAFREEQEKTFARLANQSLFDSFNSEKTDNMSISLNMTTSSSFSSKISENLPSPSYTSRNSSRTKSRESQSTDNLENEVQPLPKNSWGCDNNSVENSSQEENMKNSTRSSVSNNNSQKEWLYPNWTSENEARSSVDFPVSKSHTFDEAKDNFREGEYYESTFSAEAALMNGASEVESKTLDSPNESKRHDFKTNSSQWSEPTDHLKHFPLSNLPLNSEYLVTKDKEEEEDEKQLNQFESKAFLSNEPLSYGPPSGSSMLSSQPSSDFSSITIAPQITSPLMQDSFDHWPQYKTPKKITSLAACKNYVIFTDINKNIYYSPLSGLGLSWKLLSHQASMVSVASDGSALWMLNKKSVLSLVSSSANSPVSDHIVEIAHDIKTFAVDTLNNEVLMVTLAGKIISCNDVKSEIPCDYIVSHIACSGGMILAISNDRTLLCKLPEEEQFKVLKALKDVTSIALGPENLLWVVDKANNIFFSDDFTSKKPHWWQIQISDYIFTNSSGLPHFMNLKVQLNEAKESIYRKKCFVTTNDNSVWIYNEFDTSIYVNKTGFTGYMWNTVSFLKFLPSFQWLTLCAGGAVKDKGTVWLLALDGNIFCTTPNSQGLQSIPFLYEETIICMTSSVNTLWVLSKKGKMYSRVGLTDGNIMGTSWEEIKLSQRNNLKFSWISCGVDVAWACDIHGRTFITTGSFQSMAALDTTWIEVEGRPKGVRFEKVFVGSQLYMVWAIDTNRNLFVREGIFPNYQIGTSWVYVCGIEAVHVTISGTYVWALASNGNIYWRCGVSENNFIGDYWRNIPGNLRTISSTFTNELWGIRDDNTILRLSYKLKILREKATKENKEIRPVLEDTSWEIVK